MHRNIARYTTIQYDAYLKKHSRIFYTETLHTMHRNIAYDTTVQYNVESEHVPALPACVGN